MGARSVVGWILPLVAALAAGCGGNTTLSTDAEGGAGHAGVTGSGGSGGSKLDGGRDAATGGISFDGSDFVDPGCPDAESQEPVRECDPFDPIDSCGGGLACYPYVFHPSDQSGCGQQLYGSVCLEPGTGLQGEFCGDEFGRCAPGFICVIGAKPGKRCVELCPIDSPNTCPNGLICGEVDIEGMGVCS